MVDYCDITVFVLERDIYARQAIVSYLSWDRRTRVLGQAGSLYEMFSLITADYPHTNPNVVMLDTGLAAKTEEIDKTIQFILHKIPETRVICLAHTPNAMMAMNALRSGASGYLVRSEVGIALASAVCFAFQHHFVVTRDVAAALTGDLSESSSNLDILPARRKYHGLTQRLEQALSLCVVEGLPAEIAAEEMGVSTSTVRSYIKEVYRILEAEDDAMYPTTASPVERAFMRYSALEDGGHFPDFSSTLKPAA